MARLWYRPSAAEFAMALGATAPIWELDEDTPVEGASLGRAALVPVDAQTFGVYTAPDSGSVTTALLDANGNPMTAWVSSDDFATLGQGPAFQGPDGYEGDLFLSPDETNFFRVTPDTGTIFTRLGEAESRTITDLLGLTPEELADGESVFWDDTLGEWVVGAPAGTGTVISVNSVSPVAGNVVLTPANIAAATAADMTVVKTFGLIMLMYTGSGYPAKPAGFTLAVRSGPTFPTEQRAAGDVFLQWEAP